MKLLTTLAFVCAACAQTAPPSAATPAQPPLPPTSQAGRDGQSPLRRPLGDFAGLARYADENAKVKLPEPGEERVVFLGDSITDFWGRRYGKFFPGKPYLNRGIGAQLTNQMLVRFRADVIALEPRVVVILAGTNDIGGSLGPVPPDATRNNLMSMVELARVHGIRVVLSSLTPVCDDLGPQTDKRPMEKLRELNSWIREYASREKVVYLDYWTAMLNSRGMLRPELTFDGLHPNDAGYAVMEPLAARAVAEALKEKP
jgi:lysophospholipase L1-like esterase